MKRRRKGTVSEEVTTVKQFKLFSLLLVVILLTGCLSPRLDFTISPDPIKIQYGQSEVKGLTLNFKTSGFSLSYKLDQVEIRLEDKEDELILNQVKDLNESIPIVPGIKKPYELPAISLEDIANIEPKEAYDVYVKGEYTLTITVTGTKTSTATAKVIFE